MIYLYNIILYRPLLNALIFFYNTVALQDLGLSIIFLTILIRLILFPIFQKSTRHQMIMQRLQPKLKKIQEDHKNDREKQTQAMMALYKEHQVNPFSGFLLLLVQLPILIALYQIFIRSLRPDFLVGLYPFVSAPALINSTLFGLINLGQRSILMVGLAALAQYFQAKLSLPKIPPGQAPTAAEKMGRNMVFMGPILTLAIFYNLPAAISLYWFVASLFSVFQQAIINKQIAHGKVGNSNQKNN
jgi:YidC/Oxa1 family membrane protein insertase